MQKEKQIILFQFLMIAIFCLFAEFLNYCYDRADFYLAFLSVLLIYLPMLSIYLLRIKNGANMLKLNTFFRIISWMFAFAFLGLFVYFLSSSFYTWPGLGFSKSLYYAIKMKLSWWYLTDNESVAYDLRNFFSYFVYLISALFFYTAQKLNKKIIVK